MRIELNGSNQACYSKQCFYRYLDLFCFYIFDSCRVVQMSLVFQNFIFQTEKTGKIYLTHVLKRNPSKLITNSRQNPLWTLLLLKLIWRNRISFEKAGKMYFRRPFDLLDFGRNPSEPITNCCKNTLWTSSQQSCELFKSCVRKLSQIKPTHLGLNSRGCGG